MTGNVVVGDESSAGGGGSALKKGPWTAAEDAILMEYVKKHGEGNWNAVQKNSGLSRCGKSCRLRWANHLRPNLKKGAFSPEEERLILELHAKLGNKWARMAAQLPGRTDNEIKNYWNTRIKRRQRQGLPLYPPDIQRQAALHNQRPGPPSQTSPDPTTFTHSLQLLDPYPTGATMNFATGATPTLLPNHHHHHHHHHHSHHQQQHQHHNQTHTFLPPAPAHRLKRFHDSGAAGFPLPFSSPPVPLFHQNLQLTHFGSGSLDLNPQAPLPQSTLGSSPADAGPSPISMKLELPSSQVPEPGPSLGGVNHSYDRQGPTDLDRSNSGLLDALLQEAQDMVSTGDDSRRAISLLEPLGKCNFIGWVPPPATMPHNGSSSHLGDDTISTHSFLGITTKKEPGEDMNSVDEDLTTLLDIIPAAPSGWEWYSDSGEGSNGGHSALTGDEIGLEMQQLASSVSASATATATTTTADHDWSLGSCTWNNMPGIC